MAKEEEIPGYFVRLPSLEYSEIVSFLSNQIVLKGISPILLDEEVVEKVNSLDHRGDIVTDLQGYVKAIGNEYVERAESRSRDLLSVIGLKCNRGSFSFDNLVYFFKDWFLAKDLGAQLHDIETDYLFDAICQFYMAYAYHEIPEIEIADQLAEWICGQIAGVDFPIVFPDFETLSPKSIDAISRLSEWTEFLLLRKKISRQKYNISQIKIIWKKLIRMSCLVQEYVNKHWASCGNFVASAFLLQAKGEVLAAIPLLFSIAQHYRNLIKEDWLNPHWYPTICLHNDPRYQEWLIPLDGLTPTHAFFNVRATLDEKDKMASFRLR